MAKTIITQSGAVVNFNSLLAIYVGESRDDNGRLTGFELLGTENSKSSAIILGEYKDEQSAENAKADMIRWLKSEAFSTFEIPLADESGDQ